MNNLLVEKAKEYFALKTEHDDLSAKLKTVAEKWDAVEVELMQLLIEEGVNSIKLDGLGAFTLATRNFFNVTKENEESFYQYLKDTGNGGLLREYVNPRTLSTFLNSHFERIKETYGEDFEAKDKALDFLKQKGASVFEKKTISFRKA